MCPYCMILFCSLSLSLTSLSFSCSSFLSFSPSFASTLAFSVVLSHSGSPDFSLHSFLFCYQFLFCYIRSHSFAHSLTHSLTASAVVERGLLLLSFLSLSVHPHQHHFLIHSHQHHFLIHSPTLLLPSFVQATVGTTTNMAPTCPSGHNCPEVS